MKNESIVDRVVSRLKSQPLGDLITEEDLHDIVKQAIPKTFFEKRTVPSDSYGRTKELDPLIIEIMRDLMKNAAEKAVAAWLAENQDVVAQHWKEVLDTGILRYVQDLQGKQATTAVARGLQPMFDMLNQERQRMGLPPIYPGSF